jgi:hypothetical protein
MPFTTNCDIYGAANEQAVQRIFQHLFSQRPSLFNYASAYVAAHPFLWCHKVPYTSDVAHYNPNNIFTTEPAIPVFGASAPPVGLNFCAHLVDARIDFEPSNVIKLPAPLKQLGPQQFALSATICVGLDCPAELLGQIPIDGSQTSDKRPPPPIVPPTRKLSCFCISAFLVGHAERIEESAHDWLVGVVDQVLIPDLAPPGLRSSLECYLKITANVILREDLAIDINTLLLNIPLLTFANIQISPSPNPPIPHNPAIEQDQIKVFFDVKVTP